MASRAAKLQLLARAHKDFEFFAEHCLKIRDKEQRLVPFVLNPPQRIIHQAVEAQLAKTGKVRAIVLKSRRIGCSSYVAARFYRYASMREGQSVAIVAHIQKTTGTLYRIVKRFHEHNPLAPHVGASNIREMVFDKLDSRYSVFSAETGEGGRGEDINLVHGSEFAYYARPQEIQAGLFSAVPDKPGTEIIIESTAAGPTGEFYEIWQDAKAGRNEYLPVFVPWSADPDCYREPPPGFEPETERISDTTPSEVELMELYGLSLGQIAWRRATMNGPRNLGRFLREYPLTEEEAFSASSTYSLINPADVLRARKAKINHHGDKVIGVDPAGTGEDLFAVALRQGNVVRWVQTRERVSANEAVAWIKALIEEHGPVAVNIDVGGGGGGDAIVSLLRDDPIAAKVVNGINFSGRAQAKLARPDKPGPANRRAEMWGRLRDWLAGDAAVSLPDDEEITKDLAMPVVKELAAGDWRLESKKGARSPDRGDAIALTFANRYIQRPNYFRPEDGVPDWNNIGEAAPFEAPKNSWMV